MNEIASTLLARATERLGSASNPNDSATITSKPARGSAIGTRHGERGSSGLPSLSGTLPAVDERNPAASLPLSVQSKLAAIWSDCIGPHGWDGRVGAYELAAPISERALDEARRMADAMLEPPSGHMVLAELSRLRALTVSRDVGDDLTLIFAVFTDELKRYPADAVRNVLREWPRSHKFWPSLAELVADLDAIAAPRRALKAALDRGYEPPPYEAGWTRPGAENIAQVETMLVDQGFSRSVARRAVGRAESPAPLTKNDRAQMAAELAQWRANWESINRRAAEAAE